MALILKDLDDQLAYTDFRVTELGPSNFLIRIEGFSLLSESGVEKHECKEFESGGFKWRLVIYPNGKDQASSGDVSVYLSVANASSLGMNWEVNAVFTIFLQDQKREKYICKGLNTRQRFDALSNARGFSKFMSKTVLLDPGEGYLVNDSCVFGAEVSALRPSIERLCWKKTSSQTYVRTWTFSKFSKFKGGEYWRSPDFVCGDNKWYVQLYPKGDARAKGQSISVYLYLVDPGHHTVKAEYSIRIKNQNKDGKHHQCATTHWFSTSSSDSWGWYDFMAIADISDPKRGFLVNNCCVVEVELKVIAAFHTT